MKKKLIIEIRKHNQGQFETLKIDLRENLKEYIGNKNDPLIPKFFVTIFISNKSNNGTNK